MRSAALTHFSEVAAQCGLDGRRLVAEVGLPTRCLDEPDLKVPARLVGRLLERAAAMAAEPAFGVRMAELRRLSNLGPLALLVRDEPTLRSALEALVHHLHLHNEALTVRLEQVGDLVSIHAELWSERGEPQAQATELVVGVTFRVLGIFMGAAWRPRMVCFEHTGHGGTSRAAGARLAAHRRLFGPTVEFGHQFSGIVCNAADLDARNPAADPVMARYSRRLLAQDLQRDPSGASMVQRVRQLIVLLLPHGHCRVEAVAHHLGVDRRTVARRLLAEGTTFSEVLDSVRGDLVLRYRGTAAASLRRGAGRPLADLAALLGFSAPSAFSRWHRQRFGQPPSRHAGHDGSEPGATRSRRRPAGRGPQRAS
ncbi:MAG: AraC family transcriptional regulator ligand-binding domain-containing protein [Rubrivivax sp.]|nr:AraC family transcriptional regulator ligand-binding domain-containing protein [Rubrivivax sp.]